MEHLERSHFPFTWGVWSFKQVLGLCLVAGLLCGALVTFATAPVALALAVGAVGGLILLRSHLLGVLAVIGVVILLPFAAVPLGIGFNPTFLNLALLAAIGVWMVRVALGQQRRLVFSPVTPALLVFALMATFAFILGLGHARLSPSIARHFVELLLAIGFAAILPNILQSEAHLTLAIRAVLVAGLLAALVGVILYLLPDALALRVMSPLRLVEYNVGLRYIRDDPSLPERAIGTSVDPNAFGGLLVLVTALAAAQLFSEVPLFPKWFTAFMVGVMGVCLVLTFSRSAMVGLVCALSIIAFLRYRRLLLWMVLAGILFLILPQTQSYINHFIAGVRGEDLATQMRFGEYSDALRLIGRHPWFGVGFAGVPEIDIYLGVSSMYLLLAETTGLIGLGVFLVMMAIIFLYLWQNYQRLQQPPYPAILLGLGAGLAGAMVSGIFDHYFVNINFPSSVTQFWLFIGLALTTVEVAQQAQEEKPAGREPTRTAPLRRVGVALAVPLLIFGFSLVGGNRLARADSQELAGDMPARWTPTDAGAQTPAYDPAVLRKVDPGLLKAALENASAPQRFLVHMRSLAEPDLSGLQALPKLERRRTLVSQLQSLAEGSQAGIRAYLAKAQAQGNVQSYKPFWIFNGLAVTADARTLLDLAARPDVAMIRPDRKHQLPEPDQIPGSYTAIPGNTLEWGVQRVRANMVWDALGIDGSGVVIASMDTGVDWLHPDLRTTYRGYNDKGLPNHVGNWYSATDETYIYPGDGHGHGTHTTATAVGRNGAGVAPGARWIAVKVFHNRGHSYDSWMHDAFQWILAPAGNPDLAPDVVNASWGNDLAEDDSLREDVKRLREAGIVPVFSIGNNGPSRGTLGSPASYPEALAVGAIDEDNEVANFSSRGPSPWGEIKPEIVAPGAGVRSAVPGGGRQAWNGTSMAAPHVSGVIALMLQADPTLNPDEIEEILLATASPVGEESLPNNTAGYGLVDAYRAVATVMHAGFLRGRVLRSVDDQPIAGAQVAVATREGVPFARTTTDAEGYYDLALPAGPYQLQISAFAYQSATVDGIRVSENAYMARDIRLELQPAGVLFGQVVDETTGGPLAATIEVVDTPVVIETDPATGRFTQELPPGDYELRVRSRGHRVGHVANVQITLSQTISKVVKLAPAPTILFVDSGAWYYSGQSPFFTGALDDLNYVYDVWSIKNLGEDLPQLKDLQPYDITIWSAPRDAPGLIGASDVITQYLEAGGRLLLTGQDIGYWDGGGSQKLLASYYSRYLRAIYLQDDAGLREAYGAAGTHFDGLQIELGRGDSARNQRFPDLIEPIHDEFTQVAFYYGRPGQRDGPAPAGLVVGQCLPYRVVYLAFGFEGIETAAMRARVLERAIQTLSEPLPAARVNLAATEERMIVPAGASAQHLVKVRNAGSQENAFTISVASEDWPASLWTEDFKYPLIQPLRLRSCEVTTIGVQVDVPSDTPRHAQHQVTVRAVSQPRVDLPATAGTTVLTTKTPAAVLLVDDDRWVNVETQYQEALDRLGMGYDHWTIGWNADEALGSPPEETLAMYPVLVWFTGYDWFQTLVPDQEQMLARYLREGGRLFLSAQDYLYTNGLRDFARDYLGVFTYTEDITSTVVVGEAGNPIGDGLGPYALNYPFPNHSDALQPTEQATVVFRGKRHLPVALAHAPSVAEAQATTQIQQPAFKTLFMAFPFEALSLSARKTVMQRVIDWFSPLHNSAVSVNRPVAASGEQLAITVELVNEGTTAVQRARVYVTLPDEATYVAGSLEGASYEPDKRRIVWETEVPAGSVVASTFRVKLNPALGAARRVSFPILIEDDDQLRLQRRVEVRVNAPDLSGSEKTVSQARAEVGDVLTYAITLRNQGTADGGLMSLADGLPAQLVLVEGSLTASAGRITSDGRQIRWEGEVRRTAPVSIQYQAQVKASGIVRNVAQVDDGMGEVTQHTAVTVIPTRIYLPLVERLPAASTP